MYGNPSPVVFAVLPYLRTYSAFMLRGIVFKGIHDVAGLSEEEKQHLDCIRSITYLRNNVRPGYGTYAVLRRGADTAANRAMVENLYRAQLFVSYIYTNPDHWEGKPSFPAENASIFVFEPERVSALIVEQERYATEHSSYYLDVEPLDDTSPPYHARIEGYRVCVNGRYETVVAKGSRLYPPYYGVYLNYSQLLDQNLITFFERPANWALWVLSQKHAAPTAEEERVLTAMEWYKRSAEGRISEEEALMHLAIAFESLLGLEHGPDLTARFKETVLILLGRVERLDMWIMQFYKARSQIVHQGYWPHLVFRLTSPETGAPEKKETPSKQRPSLDRTVGWLASYGRVVFRLCLSARLAGVTATDDSVLTALLTDNETRLQSICAKLNQPNTLAADRLRMVGRLVSELAFYWNAYGHAANLDTAIAAGKRLITAYVETSPSEKEALQEALDDLANLTTTEEKFTRLVAALAGIATPTYFDEYEFTPVSDPSTILSIYRLYLQKLSHSFGA